MIKTVGVSGYGSTGSSAYVDLLNEFDETQVVNSEFHFTRIQDGLEDLGYSLWSPYFSPISINRFKKIMEEPFVRKPITRKEMDKIVNEFLNKIIQHSWNGQNNVLDMYLVSSRLRYVRNILRRILRKLRLTKLYEIIYETCNYKIDLSIMPENFDEAAKIFISEILNTLGIDCHHKEKEIIVINQAFSTCVPIRSFQFFENPMAIIVDRDPRDHYIFNKKFLYPRGVRLMLPCDNVDSYIKYFRIRRRCLPDLHKRKDIMFCKFEELVYDCDNITKKVTDFLGLTRHVHKGEYFKPTHSRNNTQLFKKYTDLESDIKKIERELPEFIFPFENYPDIKPEGKMFWGSQLKKNF